MIKFDAERQLIVEDNNGQKKVLFDMNSERQMYFAAIKKRLKTDVKNELFDSVVLNNPKIRAMKFIRECPAFINEFIAVFRENGYPLDTPEDAKILYFLNL